MGRVRIVLLATAIGGQPSPEDEASARAGIRAGDATGKVPPIKTDFWEVARDIGWLRTSVSVRYNKSVEPKDLPGGKL